jgi:hypothetical protein
MAAIEEPFNPLNRLALAESVVNHLIARPAGPLPPQHSFLGAGVYAIYYVGVDELYGPIADENPETPIYVGKAIPRGGRIGGFDLAATAGQVLYNRLREHAETIRLAQNLDHQDFRCRYLVVEDIWIPLAEQLMISRYRPVWNHVVGGFGNHHVGRTRFGQARPLWDELHPGRAWAAQMQRAELTAQEIMARVRAHFAGPQTDEEGIELAIDGAPAPNELGLPEE